MVSYHSNITYPVNTPVNRMEVGKLGGQRLDPLTFLVKAKLIPEA